MMWVCRTGVKSVFLNEFVQDKRIYIPWDGYNLDLSAYSDRDALKRVVIEEKGECQRTSISNWAGQLYSFVKEISVGDYVLIPHRSSKEYTLAVVSGQYEYNSADNRGLFHSRTIEIQEDRIPREIFSQSIQYSLGAFRTIFKVKQEEEVLIAINKWKDKGGAE